jgi:hypothetical protein
LLYSPTGILKLTSNATCSGSRPVRSSNVEPVQVYRYPAVGRGEERPEHGQGNPVLALLTASFDERMIVGQVALGVRESHLSAGDHEQAERLGEQVERAARFGAQFRLRPTGDHQRADEGAARRERRLGEDGVGPCGRRLLLLLRRQHRRHRKHEDKREREGTARHTIIRNRRG